MDLQQLPFKCDNLQLPPLSCCCVQSSGTFWLSRLLRDRDARVQAAALALLVRCSGPGATATQELILQVRAFGMVGAPGAWGAGL